jgi:hypothetical protein
MGATGSVSGFRLHFLLHILFCYLSPMNWTIVARQISSRLLGLSRAVHDAVDSSARKLGNSNISIALFLCTK